MLRFVHQQNMARYVELLEAETDGAKRERLEALLIEEENRFGSVREKVEELDRLIVEARARVRQQQKVVGQLTADGDDGMLAERLLANMTATLELFSAHRERLLHRPSPDEQSSADPGA